MRRGLRVWKRRMRIDGGVAKEIIGSRRSRVRGVQVTSDGGSERTAGRRGVARRRGDGEM